MGGGRRGMGGFFSISRSWAEECEKSLEGRDASWVESEGSGAEESVVFAVRGLGFRGRGLRFGYGFEI
jgi:hypothetical protein